MSEDPEYRMRRRLAWLAGAALVWTAGAAAAQTARPVALEAAGLEPALIALADQTGQQIMFSKSVVAGRRAPAVAGTLTPEQALDRLLAGSGLAARRVSARMLVVEPAAGSGPADRAADEAPGGRPFRAGNAAAAPAEAGGGGAAAAADAAVAAAPTMLETVTVTGSNIRGAESPSPLLVIDRADLERSGYPTLAGALNALPQAFGGGANEATFNTGADRIRRNTGYGTSLNLRGLGSDATLVLVNGHRLAGSGSFGDFTDISGIPTAAVARVEILLDGASAIYGADAVGGVVNIILRQDYDGAETRAFAGVGTAGEPVQTQISQTLGRQWDGGGVLLAYEYQTRAALAGADRAFTTTADLRALGGSDQRQTSAFPGNILGVDPATGGTAPRWGVPPGQTGVGLRPEDLQAGAINLQNQRQGADTLPRQVLQAAYLAAHQDVGAGLRLSGDVRYSFRRFALDLVPQATTLTVDRGNPFYVSPDGAASERIAYSFAGDVLNPRSSGSVETWAATAGASLDLPAAWRADGYLGWGQEITEQRTVTTFNTRFLAEALGSVPDDPATAYSAGRDGYFNPFNGVAGAGNATALAFINSGFGATRVRVRSAVASLQADGPLLDLPGGPLKLAVGGQARRESLRYGGSTLSTTLTPVPLSSAFVSRETLAAFAELRAPLVGDANGRRGLRRLEFSLAGRVERFDDVGATANPKAGLLWAPLDGLTVRATYGRSFRAPALREVHDRRIHTQSTLPLADGSRVRVMLLQGGNPDLEPETATSWTVGFDLRPQGLPGLTLSATAFDIRFHNRIGRPVQQNAISALYDPTLASFVRRISPGTNAEDLAYLQSLIDDPAFNPARGEFPPSDYVAVVDNRYVNTTTLRVRGLDVQAGYRFAVRGDPVALGLNATWMADYREQITPTSGTTERVGRAGYPVALRGRATADWTHGALGAGVAVNYIDSYRDALGTRIHAQTTVDLQLRWAAERGWAKDWALLLTLRNALDADPPFYDNASGVGYDPTNADPIGRFASVQLTRRW
mgnify:CR=1 FL=1